MTPARVNSVIFASRIMRRSAYNPIHERIEVTFTSSGWSDFSPDAARSARSARYTGRSTVAGGNEPTKTMCLAKSPRSAIDADGNVPSVDEMRQRRVQLLGGVHDLDRLLLADGENDTVRPCRVRLQDELRIVRRPGRDRCVHREGGAVVPVHAFEDSFQRRRLCQVGPNHADLLDALLEEGIRHQQGAPRARRVQCERVRRTPVGRRHVRRDARDACRRQCRRHFRVARRSGVVDRGDYPRLVELPGALHRLVDVGTVVTDVDLDARTVRPAPGVERRSRRP